MKIEYTLALLAVGLIYAVIKQFVPDFPVAPEVFQAIVFYLVVKLGIELVGKPAANALRAKFR